MYKRVWTPRQTKTAYTGTITFYDSGIVCGELFNDSWLSWEILDRKRIDGKIIETLRELSQDYVPFEVLHTETHEAVEDSSGNICIPGWIINYEMSNLSSPLPLQAPPLKPSPLKQAQPPVTQASQPAPRPPPRPQLPPPWVPPPQELLEVEAPPTQTTLAQASSEKTAQKPTKNRQQQRRQGNQKQPLQPVTQPSVSYPPHLQPLAEILLAPPLTQQASTFSFAIPKEIFSSFAAFTRFPTHCKRGPTSTPPPPRD